MLSDCLLKGCAVLYLGTMCFKRSGLYECKLLCANIVMSTIILQRLTAQLQIVYVLLLAMQLVCHVFFL